MRLTRVLARSLATTRWMEGLTLMHLIWVVTGVLLAISLGVDLGDHLRGVVDLTPGH